MYYPIRSMPETWGTVGTTLITVIFLWDIFLRYCPQELRDYLGKWTTFRLSGFLNPYIQISIHEYLNGNLNPHEAYALVEAYLSVNSSKEAKRLKAEMAKDNGNKLMLSMDENEKTTDEFNGVKVTWISGKSTRAGHPSDDPEPDERYYRLEFHKMYKEMIIGSYLEHVIKTGKEIKQRNRERKLYTNGHSCHGGSHWSKIVFEHPASFENLAMELDKRQEIVDDLLTFAKSKDYFARIGKAWKRGYLLYGPPGTGKSTMIAAMANLLEYDIYDLELTSVRDNKELRRLLTETTSKSIIVIEDIDCSLDLTGQRKTKQKTEVDEGDEKRKKESKEERVSKVTLSGLLNVIDGLWSASAGERLIVFTTNYVHKLDPALIRRGRMDKHIELSYCKYEGFKVLARNYLEIEEHPLFQRVEELIGEVEITPADVAENLIMPKSSTEGQEKCLLNLIQTLEEAKRRKSGNTQKTKGDQQETELGS